MYRLPYLTLLAISLTAIPLASAQESNLEIAYIEELNPTNQAVAPSATSEASEVGVEPIDFQDVFDWAPIRADKRILQRPSIDASGMLEAESVPVVQPTTALQEMDIETPVRQLGGSHSVVDGVPLDDVTLNLPIAAEDGTVNWVHCNGECDSMAACDCRSKSSCMSLLEEWWHNTDLYRLHIQNLGDAGMSCDRPFGVCNEGFTGAMIVAGKADRAILHHYDFVQHPDHAIELTHRGYRELTRIAGIMIDYPVPLSIESTHDSVQDAARRNAVVNAITQLGLPISPDSVRISNVPTIGLSGLDAQAIQAIRAAEAVTGASRTRPYSDTSGAVVIPVLTSEGSSGK